MIDFPALLGAIVFVTVVYLLVRATVLAQKDEDRTGWLYFIGAKEGPVKVGMTRDEVTDRLRALQTGHPERLAILYQLRVDDPEEAEQLAHRILYPDVVHGEWYQRDPVLDLIARLKENDE